MENAACNPAFIQPYGCPGSGPNLQQQAQEEVLFRRVLVTVPGQIDIRMRTGRNGPAVLFGEQAAVPLAGAQSNDVDGLSPRCSVSDVFKVRYVAAALQ